MCSCNTSLQWKYFIPIFVTGFASTVTKTLAFPFLPMLIESFGYTEVETGSKVGFIGACFFLGCSIGSVFWGWIVDTFNRRNVAVISGILLALATLAFGFSLNLTWTVIARFSQGLFSGFQVVAKALLIDLTDENNRSFAMSMLLGTYNNAITVGSAVGGLLSFPSQQYPLIFGGVKIFEKFGVLLPCGLVATLLFISTISVLFTLPKIQNATNKNEISELLGEFHDTEENKLETSEALNYKKKNNSKEKDEQNASEKNYQKNLRITKYIYSSKLGQVFRSRSFNLVTWLYFLYSFTAIGFEEIFPLYAATARKYHGYGFTPSVIGITLLIESAASTIPQFIIFPKVVGGFGPRKAFIYANLTKSVLVLSIPFYENISNKYVFWSLLLVTLLVIRCTISICFISVSLLVNNSIMMSLIGTAFGVAMSIATLGRAFSVPTFGSLYSWSLTNVVDISQNKHALGFPFDQYFVFFIFSILSIICAFYAFCLPTTLDNPYCIEYSN